MPAGFPICDTEAEPRAIWKFSMRILGYYAAELTLARAQLNEMLDYVQLYRALGGGWQQ